MRHAPSNENMSDVAGAEGDETVCPVCDGTNIEEIVDGNLDYQCRDCGAEFDPSGGRVNVE